MQQLPSVLFKCCRLMDNPRSRESTRKWESAEKQRNFSRLSSSIPSWIHDSISGSNYLCFPIFQCAWVPNFHESWKICFLRHPIALLTTKSAANSFRPLLFIPYLASNVISANKEPPKRAKFAPDPSTHENSPQCTSFSSLYSPSAPLLSSDVSLSGASPAVFPSPFLSLEQVTFAEASHVYTRRSTEKGRWR